MKPATPARIVPTKRQPQININSLQQQSIFSFFAPKPKPKIIKEELKEVKSEYSDILIERETEPSVAFSQ